MDLTAAFIFHWEFLIHIFPLWFEIAQPYNDTVGQKNTTYFSMILFIFSEGQIPNCVIDVS